jgi:hypothetical protein
VRARGARARAPRPSPPKRAAVGGDAPAPMPPGARRPTAGPLAMASALSATAPFGSCPASADRTGDQADLEAYATSRPPAHTHIYRSTIHFTLRTRQRISHETFDRRGCDRDALGKKRHQRRTARCLLPCAHDPRPASSEDCLASASRPFASNEGRDTCLIWSRPNSSGRWLMRVNQRYSCRPATLW